MGNSGGNKERGSVRGSGRRGHRETQRHATTPSAGLLLNTIHRVWELCKQYWLIMTVHLWCGTRCSSLKMLHIEGKKNTFDEIAVFSCVNFQAVSPSYISAQTLGTNTFNFMAKNVLRAGTNHYFIEQPYEENTLLKNSFFIYRVCRLWPDWSWVWSLCQIILFWMSFKRAVQGAAPHPFQTFFLFVIFE